MDPAAELARYSQTAPGLYQSYEQLAAMSPAELWSGMLEQHVENIADIFTYNHRIPDTDILLIRSTYLQSN